MPYNAFSMFVSMKIEDHYVNRISQKKINKNEAISVIRQVQQQAQLALFPIPEFHPNVRAALIHTCYCLRGRVPISTPTLAICVLQLRKFLELMLDR